MNPNLIKLIKKSDTIHHFSSVFGLSISQLKQVELHDGAANLVYYISGPHPSYLRISYRKDRSFEMINSELNFLNYLAEHAYPCPKPIRSLNKNLCEQYQVDGHLLTASLFSEIKGKQIYEMQFQMPKGVSLSQFWQECGKVLGRLHSLSQSYCKVHDVTRFNWLQRHTDSLSFLFPENEKYQTLLHQVITDIGKTPQNSQTYGLCHNDFNVCNFLIDYESLDFEMTLIDFDDSGFNYYMYDLACFWEMCTGWAINIEPAHKWKEFMHRCFSVMLEEYHKHFQPGFDAIVQLPDFLKAVHLENILEPMRELHYADKVLKPDNEILYHLYCLENNIEFLGLFDQVFDPNHPFSLE